MKKSVFVVPGWWPSSSNPYEGVFILEHVKAIASNYDVVVILCVYQKQFVPGFSISKDQSHGFDEIRITIGSPIYIKPLFIALLRKAISNIIDLNGIPNLLHVHVLNKASFRVAVQLKKLNIPLFISEHSSYYHHGLAKLTENVRDAEQKRIRTWFQELSPFKITTVSKDLMGSIQSITKLPAQRFSVIPNVASNHFTEPPITFSDNQTDEIRMLLCANWAPPKNPLLFFDALAECAESMDKSLRVDILGFGQLIPKMKEAAATKLGSVKVQFHGSVTKSQFSQALTNADFFVHPSEAENLPTVIIEALCMGLPVLSMNINGIPELVDESNGILVAPQNLEELKKGIHEMCIMYPQYNRQKIAQEARNNFSSASIATQFDKIYEEL